MKTIVLDVHGMSCHHCVRTVRHTLLEVEGVSTVDVTLHPGRPTRVKGYIHCRHPFHF